MGHQQGRNNVQGTPRSRGQAWTPSLQISVNSSKSHPKERGREAGAGEWLREVASPRGSGLASPRGVRLLVAGLVLCFFLEETQEKLNTCWLELLQLGSSVKNKHNMFMEGHPTRLTRHCHQFFVWFRSAPSPPGFLATRG